MRVLLFSRAIRHSLHQILGSFSKGRIRRLNSSMRPGPELWRFSDQRIRDTAAPSREKGGGMDPRPGAPPGRRGRAVHTPKTRSAATARPPSGPASTGTASGRAEPPVSGEGTRARGGREDPRHRGQPQGHKAYDVLLFGPAHPRWESVFQPKEYAACLNLIEPWWKTLKSLALKGRRVGSWGEIEAAVTKALDCWNEHRHPYAWGRRRRDRPARRLGVAAMPRVASVSR